MAYSWTHKPNFKMSFNWASRFEVSSITRTEICLFKALNNSNNVANTRSHCGTSETSEAAGHPWHPCSVVTLLPGVNERPVNSLTETGLRPCRTNRRQWDKHWWHQNTNKFPSPHYTSRQDSTPCLIIHKQDSYHHLTKCTSGVRAIPDTLQWNNENSLNDA